MFYNFKACIIYISIFLKKITMHTIDVKKISESLGHSMKNLLRRGRQAQTFVMQTARE